MYHSVDRHGDVALAHRNGIELEIYLDNLASTPVDPRVAEHQSRLAVSLPANPNSGEHSAGMRSADAVGRAREGVSAFLGGVEEDVRFLPSASSALWVALEDAMSIHGDGMRVLASAIEHPSLLHHLHAAKRAGRITLELFPVGTDGQPDLDELGRMTVDRAGLICMMAANNELGTVAPVGAVTELARRCGASMLVDASQAAGRFPVGGITASVDYLIASGAKMYGPRRVGVLAGSLSRPTLDRLEPMFGTPDAAAASAMALACELRSVEMEEDEKRITALRDKLQALLLDAVPGLVVNGDLSARLAGALHVSTPYFPGEAVTARLWGRIAVSTGAACQSGAPGPSHVLAAMAVADWIVDGALRICVGKFNDMEDIERAGPILAAAMQEAPTALQRYA